MPYAVFSTPSTALEVSHVISTSYLAGAFIIVAYASLMLIKTYNEKKRSYYKKAIKLALIVGIIALFFALVTGLISISALIHLQPEKFAAIEGNINSQAYAPERLGGIPVNGTLRYYIPIPNLQSVLATGNASGVVPGLNSYPRSTWPPLIIHLMFDLLLAAAGFVTLIVAFFVILAILGKRPFESKLALSLLVLSGVLAVFALEDGWVMEELGRQPWIIYNVMLVSQAANTTQGISPIAVFILLFYIAVIPATIIVIRKVFAKRLLENELVSN
jgi:cytochrome d ubiquinol oxidase subunit I